MPSSSSRKHDNDGVVMMTVEDAKGPIGAGVLEDFDEDRVGVNGIDATTGSGDSSSGSGRSGGVAGGAVAPVGGISNGSINFGIPTNRGTQHHVDETHGKESWRYKVLRFLHSHAVQFFMMSLLILDVLMLFVELYLLATYPHCHTIERDAISCCPSSPVSSAADADVTDRRLVKRWLAGNGDGHDDDHHDYCDHQDGLVAFKEYGAGCDSHKWHKVHTAEEILFAMTIAILCIFFLELNIEMMALHPTIFFQQFFFLLDYVIVTVSLTLEIIFHVFNEDIIQSMVGLLVLVRIWRFVRIGHGIVEVVAELSHTKYQELLAYTEALESQLRENNIHLPSPTLASTHHDENNILSAIEKEHRQKHMHHRHSGRQQK